MVYVNKLPKKMSTKERLKVAIEAAFRLFKKVMFIEENYSKLNLKK